MTEENKVPKIRFPEFTDDWEQRRLGDITDSYSGGTPKVGKSEYYNGEIPFIRSGEISSDHTELFITKEGLENSSAAMVNKGDILYALYGATSGEVNRSQITGAINQAILAILPHENFDSEFIMQWLRKNKASIISTYLQGGQGNLSGTIVKDLQIILPPYKEQVKIGQFLQSVDKLITLHQRKLETTQKLKQGFLQKLFPQNGKKIPELRFPEFSGDWEQRKLEEISPLRGGFAFKSEKFTTKGIPIVKISNILQDGSVGADFSYYDMLPEDEKFTLKNGDVVLAMSGATTGKVSVLTCKEDEKYYQNQRVGYFTRTGKFDYDFVSVIVRSPLFIEQLKSVLVAGAQPNVSPKDIDSFEFMVPHQFDEQKKIGQFFKSLDNLITLHQRKLEIYQNIKKGLLQQMFV